MYEYNSAKKEEEEVLHPADDERTEGGSKQSVVHLCRLETFIQIPPERAALIHPSTKQASAAIRVAAQVGHSRAKVSRLVALMKRAGIVKWNQILTEFKSFYHMQST